jgi:hypothetical protein
MMSDSASQHQPAGLPFNVQVESFYSSEDFGKEAIESLNGWLVANRTIRVLKVVHSVHPGWHVMFTVEYARNPPTPGGLPAPTDSLRQVAGFTSSGDFGKAALAQLNSFLAQSPGSRKILEIHHHVYPGWHVFYTVDFIQL